MGAGKKVSRGAAAEAVGFRINEGPRRPRRLPFMARYVGEGVVSVEGVGLFARWTRAEVDADTAARLAQDPRWEIEPSAPPPGPLTGPAPGAPGAAS
jgi:hypothetical protein